MSFEYLKKKRTKFTRDQTKLLEDFFKVKNTITSAEREQIAGLTGMTHREVQVWFQNRRAKQNKQTRNSPLNLEMRKRQMVNVRVRKTSNGIIIMPSPMSPREMLLPEPPGADVSHYLDTQWINRLPPLQTAPLPGQEPPIPSFPQQYSSPPPTQYPPFMSKTIHVPYQTPDFNNHPLTIQIQPYKSYLPQLIPSVTYSDGEKDDDIFDLFSDPFSSYSKQNK